MPSCTSAGSYTIAVRATDNTSQQSQPATYTFQVGVDPAPVSVAVDKATVGAGDMPVFTLNIQPVYPCPLTATVTLSATTNAAGLTPGYQPQSLRFPTTTIDSKQTTLLIPANAPSIQIPVQAGSVAGDVTLKVSSLLVTGSSQQVTIGGSTSSGQTTVQRAAPTISQVQCAIGTDGKSFQVAIDAVSTPRDLTEADLSFSPASGKSIDTAQPLVFKDTDSKWQPSPTDWFKSAASQDAAHEGNLRILFGGTASDASVLGSVQVTLANSVGRSAASATSNAACAPGSIK
jgi:hypothetical protein